MATRMFVSICLGAALAAAGDDAERRIAELERRAEADGRRIRELEEHLARRQSAHLAEEVEAYLEEAGHAHGDTHAGRLDLSAVLLVGGGGSTEGGETLLLLQDGAHDPRRRGFTFQQLELSLVGEAGEHLRGEVHVILALAPEDGETEVELEEAFAQVVDLPGGFALEAGHFFTEFGLHNPLHPHAWLFADRPVVLTRFFGPDGMRAPGVRVQWTAPLAFPLRLHAGLQNAEGETMASFLGDPERAVAGRPATDREVEALDDLVTLVRVEALSSGESAWRTGAGLSAAFGPNATGPGGRTILYGVDLFARWRPATHDDGWPFFAASAEVVGRSFRADAFDDGTTTFARRTFTDHGAYVQAVYGWRRPWAAGLRGEFATGEGAEARDDPLRDDRWRLSALLLVQAAEASRLRLQVNWDESEALGSALSFWVVFELGLGRHGGHAHGP